MNSTACISNDRLKLLVLGELPEPDAAPLEQHLLACPNCVERTRSLRLDDTLVTALHRASGSCLPDEPAIEQLVQRLSGLATHSSLLDETQAPKVAPSRGLSDLIARLEPAAAADELGRLGGFRILKLLGQGGMGAVFLAEDLQLRRRVALKLLRPEQAAQLGATERFLREARAAANVRHDHVVTIFQVGQAQGMPFIAQELLEGETLEDRLKRDGRLPIGEALRIGREIAAGLAAAHQHGLLHRDIKPSNVWLEASGRREPPDSFAAPTGPTHREADASRSPARTKLLDFGLARNQQGDEQLTQSGAIVGTPAYMSPEQAQGRELDARTDLFSLGCVLYRMVTGRLPFPGTDVLSILRSLAVDEPPPAPSLNPEVPAELSQLISDLLQKDRNQRPASAAAVAARLADIESSWDRPLACPKKPTSRRFILPLVAAAAALLIAFGIFLTVNTPYGKVTVELGKNVEPEDVQIEVAGNGNLQIADATNNWTIDVKEGQYSVRLKGGNDKLDISQRSVTVFRNKEAHVVVTLKPLMQSPLRPARKLLYENDFSQPDPNWVLPDEEHFVYRDGKLIILDHTRRAWWYGYVPCVESPEIEVVGRATGGSWGIFLTTAGPQTSGIAVVAEPQGEVLAMHVSRPTPIADWDFRLMLVRQKTHQSWKSAGEFNRMRVEVKGRQLLVWLNDESACEPIEMPDPILLSNVKLLGRGAKEWQAEFKSIRVWSASEDAPKNPDRGSLASRAEPPLAVAPFNATEAKAHQLAWSKYLGLPAEYQNAIGLKLVLIPPGEFTMGNSSEQAAAIAALHPSDAGWTKPALSTAPAHRVRLTQPYYLGIWEVTQGQYEQVAGHNPSQFSAGGVNRPVESVHYADIAAFCNLLSQREGLQPQYSESSGRMRSPPGDGYRLPTEAQWEFACRAGTTTAWYTGDGQSDLAQAAWYAPTAGRTSHDAGQLQPNSFGLFDMHGNVWEWCQDWYGENTYTGRTAAINEDPTGPDVGVEHILRGGTWGAEAADTRSAARGAPFANRSNGYGFRVLLPVEGMRKLLSNPSHGKSPPDPQVLAKRMAAMPPLEIVGDWQIQDGFLIQGLTKEGYGSLRFGDPAWTDYDVRAKVTLGAVWTNEFGLIGRGEGYNRCEYILADFANPTNRDLIVFAAGQDGWNAPTRRFLSQQAPLRPGSTHLVELRLRGARMTSLLDGKEVSTTVDGRLAQGRAGFSSWGGVRFSEIEVRTPDGTLLWSGLPPVKTFSPEAAPKTGDPARAVAPFSATEASVHQDAWAKHLKVPVEYTNSLGMKLRLIPPGEFLMGSPPNEVAELLSQWDSSDKRGPECIHSGAPQHRVTLTRPIYAGILEVTQQQYVEIMGQNPSAFSKAGAERAALEKAQIADAGNLPVESVSWQDAIEFCQKLTIREKLHVGGGYRLPTEAEWEFACRAGTTSQYHSGDGEAAATSAGWFAGNSGGHPQAGGELAANAFGLHDLHGNVWEWMLDRRDITAYSRRADGAVDPQSLTTDTTQRVLRGGNWRTITDVGRAAFRDGRDEFHRHYDYGFRVWLPVESLLASAAKSGKPIGKEPGSAAEPQQP